MNADIARMRQAREKMNDPASDATDEDKQELDIQVQDAINQRNVLFTNARSALGITEGSMAAAEIQRNMATRQFANPQDKWNAYSAALATKGLNTAEHEKANGQLWTDALSPADRDYIMHRSNATPPPVQNPNALPKAPKPGTPIPTDPVARKDFLKKFMTASGNDPKKAIQLMQEQGYDTAPVAPAAK